ncbi:MAG: hypothetical protein JNM50_05450 [Chromatiales bacterium]|nr:hypothetical protein [Chromatiales bacterium]
MTSAMLVGAAGVAIVVTQSLSATATSRREQEVHVALAEIGRHDITRVTWRGQSVVIPGGGEPRAFLIPFDPERGVYLMPDRSWARPLIPCQGLVLVDDVLQCASIADTDMRLRCWDPCVTTMFAWRRTDGASLNAYIPNLESLPYIVDEGTLILGRVATD